MEILKIGLLKIAYKSFKKMHPSFKWFIIIWPWFGKLRWKLSLQKIVDYTFADLKVREINEVEWMKVRLYNHKW